MGRFAKAGLTAVMALGLGSSLAGCAEKNPAPTTVGVCYHAIPQKNGTIKFNPVPSDKPIDSIEKCAAALEGMRVRFLSMGGANEIMGAFQGSYLFFTDEGIFRSDRLEGSRYVMLVRTGDGRLAMPGAMPQQ